MYDVRIPDSLYQQASHAAEARHVSVDEFIAEVVQLHLQDNGDAPIRLTDKQATIIAKAEADIDAGKFFTSEQVRGYFNEKKTACPPSSRP